MTNSDAAPRPDARLIEDAKNWLPTDDPEAHRSIVGLLAMIAQAGVDPIAALRDALHRWFGPAAPGLLRPRTMTEPARPSAPGLVALEPLPPLRRPTLWPQRPKRFADELFSSWLWRASVAAGVPPKRFAAETLGVRYADPDTEVPEGTLRRLALLSGQSVSRLAAGTLSGAPPLTRGDVVFEALLQHGGFLLRAKARIGRRRAQLQYCPRCLATDPQPYFRRSWRFAVAAVCVRHGCRLHDACWRCGALIDLLDQVQPASAPRCAACRAVLAEAARTLVPDAVTGQRGLMCVLYYAAVALEPEALRRHLDALANRFLPGSPATERQRAIANFGPSHLEQWFGPMTDVRHGALMRRHARGGAHGLWFGADVRRRAGGSATGVLLAGGRPLSRERAPRAPWFAPSTRIPPAAAGGARSARPPRQARSTESQGDGPCRPPA